jgi:hypothetical protein
MSIVRVGLAETKKFASGYDAIFAKKPRTKTLPKPAAKKKSAKKR